MRSEGSEGSKDSGFEGKKMSEESGFINVRDAAQLAIEHIEQMKNMVYVDKGFVVLNVVYPYEIGLDKDIKDPLELLGWVTHLIS